MSDLTKLIIEDINDKYAYIQYNNFNKVMLMKSVSYVNATKFCNDFDSNKRFRDWKRNQQSEELILEVETILSDKSRSAIIVIEDGNNEFRGIYVHPLLINSIAQWISPKYAIYVNNLMNRYHIDMKDKTIFNLETMIKENREHHELAMENARNKHHETKLQYEQQILEIRKTRKEVVVKHNELIKNFNDLNTQNTSIKTEVLFLKTQNNSLLESSKALTTQLMSMTIKNDKLRNLIVDVHSKISAIPMQIIDPEKRSFIVGNRPDKMTTTFIILTVIEMNYPDICTFYTVNRIQYRNHKSAIARSISKVLAEYKDPIYTYYYPFFESSANAVTTWNIIKSSYKLDSGCILLTTEKEFHRLLNQLRKININPEDELKILNDELIKLQNSTEEEDKEFLAELESDDI